MALPKKDRKYVTLNVVNDLGMLSTMCTPSAPDTDSWLLCSS